MFLLFAELLWIDNLSSSLGACRHGFADCRDRILYFVALFLCSAPFFQNDSMLCASSLSVRNPCINKLLLYTEPLVWDVLPLLCPVFHATSASFAVFFFSKCLWQTLAANTESSWCMIFFCLLPLLPKTEFCCVNKTLVADGNPLVCVASSGLTLVPSCSYASFHSFFSKFPW